jgi:Putative peptidoglycan binding domain
MNPYRFGTRSAETRALQQRLAARGLDTGPVDGIFGHQTQAAVDTARQRFGLLSGGVDAALLRALAPPKPSLVSGLAAALAKALIVCQLKGLTRMTFLSGYKTYIIAGAMLLAGLAGLLGIDIPSFTGQAPGDLVMEALAFFFLRQGLKTDAAKG